MFTRAVEKLIGRWLRKTAKRSLKAAAKTDPRKRRWWKVSITWYNFKSGWGSVIMTAPTLRQAYHKLASEGYKVEVALAKKTKMFELYVGMLGIYFIWKSQTEEIPPCEPEEFRPQDEDGTIWVPDTTSDEETDDHSGSEVQETPTPDSEDSFLDTSSPWTDG